MPLIEAVWLALLTVRAHKLKSGFSLLGVFVGVTCLIGAWSIVNGMNRYMTEKFANTLFGVNTFQLRRRPLFTPHASDSLRRAWARRPRIRFSDAEAVRAGLSVPVVTAWESSDRVTLEYGGRKAREVDLTTATERYFDIKNLRLASGRTFTPQEARSGLPVVVIGDAIAERLFQGRDPIDQPLRIGGIPYRVIGVVERQGNLLGFPLDRFVVAPARSAAQDLVNPPGIIDALLVKAGSQVEMRQAMAQAEGILRSRRHLRPRQDNNFELETSDGVQQFWAGIRKVLVVVGPGLVGVSLVVGGIVIMNIMLMAVAERTQEIGLRKSLGARRRDILRQFLWESIAIAAAGAALGIVAGTGLTLVLAAATPLPATLSPASVVLGVVVGAGVGVAAGVYPASRAARLDPVAALRQE